MAQKPLRSIGLVRRTHENLKGRSFLRMDRLVFVAYGKLACFLLLTVQIRCHLVFAYGGNSVWSFFAYSLPPRPDIRFGLFCLRFPPP